MVATSSSAAKRCVEIRLVRDDGMAEGWKADAPVRKRSQMVVNSFMVPL